MTTMMKKAPQALCRRCRFPGSDVRLQGCGCHLHARCLPLSLIFNANSGQPQFGPFPAPNTSPSTLCPVCSRGMVTGIVLEPLRFEDVERAVRLRKEAATPLEGTSTSNNNGVVNPQQQQQQQSTGKKHAHSDDAPQQQEQQQQSNGKKHARSDDDPVAQADSSYLLLASSSLSSISSGSLSREQQRTGRWTNEEIAFVDRLVAGFDNCSLPLPHGIKLNEFLGDMLLCKSSRLTKKMKNAKLSSRSFALNAAEAMATTAADNEVLSTLQERFLSAVPSEASQLELRFNLAKQWRTHFSNLCIQVGYPFLDATNWVASVEELEERATTAEDNMRRVRRRRMGMALQTDGGSSANPSVFIGGVKADNAASKFQPTLDSWQSSTPFDEKVRTISSTDMEGGSTSFRGDDSGDAFSLLLDSSANSLSPKGPRGRSRTLSNADFLDYGPRSRAFSDDFDAVLDTLMDDDVVEQAEPVQQRTSSPHACGPFLDAIVHYMEAHNLPFQYADLWVPSFSARDGDFQGSTAGDTEELRLYYAGHASRGDLDQDTAYKLNEFGVYSDNFSFEPGHGLPGRVYSSGKISWEPGVQDKDPKIFERAGGAKVYGIQTAVGIPLNAPMVGRIVVAMYSSENVPENMAVAHACAADLMKYAPEPKWKLCIDMNEEPTPDQPNEQFMPTISEAGMASPIMYKSQPSTESSTNLSNMPPVWDSNATQQPMAPSAVVVPLFDQDDRDLVSLLGQNMPMANGSTSPAGSSDGLSDFMSLRLLLLRVPEKRSAQENELIEILKSSYRSYVKDDRRTQKELAGLLVKDWICLKSTYGWCSPALSVQSAPRPLAQPLSHPVARRLSTMEPPQRQTSGGSLQPTFQSLMQSPYMQSIQQSFQSTSNNATGGLKPQYQSAFLSQQTQPTGTQMMHVNYSTQTSSPAMRLPNAAMPSPSITSMDSYTGGINNNINPLAPASAFPSQPIQSSSMDAARQR